MGQLKVRFSIEHQSGQSTFTNRSELEQAALAQQLLHRLSVMTIQLKLAAANNWLQQKISLDNMSRYHIQYTSVPESMESS